MYYSSVIKLEFCCIFWYNKKNTEEENITDNLSFSLQSEKISAFFKTHNIDLPGGIYNELLEFISSACLYEEEGRKIRPSLIVGNNLTDNHFSRILQATVLCIIKENKKETHIKKRLKSLIPFCENGWRIFISFDFDDVSYGILRNFNGPTGLNFDDLLFSLLPEEIKSFNLNYILIDVINNFEILLKGNSSTLKIDFKLSKHDTYDENFLNRFCDDIIGAIGSDKRKLKIAFMKILNLFSQKLHGSICLVVDHTYNLPDEVIKDGVFLPNPLDICSILTEELNDDINDVSGIVSVYEKYYAFTGLLLEMLNFDGITIVDNKGRLRAYNVFVNSDINSNNALSGGARKRAAEFLCNQKNPHYLGVYFQSQDGLCFYKKVNKNG